MTEVIKNKPYQVNEEKAEFYRINGGKSANVTLEDGSKIKGRLGRFFVQGAIGLSIILMQGVTDTTIPIYRVRRIDLQ